MFIVGRKMCLLRIEVLHFSHGCRFVDYKEEVIADNIYKSSIQGPTQC
jgi:hypothetical protein